MLLTTDTPVCSVNRVSPSLAPSIEWPRCFWMGIWIHTWSNLKRLYHHIIHAHKWISKHTARQSDRFNTNNTHIHVRRICAERLRNHKRREIIKTFRYMPLNLKYIFIIGIICNSLSKKIVVHRSAFAQPHPSLSVHTPQFVSVVCKLVFICVWIKTVCEINFTVIFEFSSMRSKVYLNKQVIWWHRYCVNGQTRTIQW